MSGVGCRFRLVAYDGQVGGRGCHFGGSGRDGTVWEHGLRLGGVNPCVGRSRLMGLVGI